MSHAEGRPLCCPRQFQPRLLQSLESLFGARIETPYIRPGPLAPRHTPWRDSDRCRAGTNGSPANVTCALGDGSAVAKVIQNGPAAAAQSVGIVEYLVKLLASVSLQRFNLRLGKHGITLANLVDEKFLCVPVTGTAIQNAVRGPTVASGATSLLVVGLQTGRNVVMDYKAEVSLVDPHSKGIGRHNHRTGVCHEVFLALLAGLSVHASVIGAYGTVGEALLEQCRQLLYQLASGTVDDAAARLLGETMEQGRVLFAFRIQAAADIA